MRHSAAWLAPLAAGGLWLAGLVAYLVQQEVPTSRLRGVALAEETGEPLPGAVVELQFVGGNRQLTEREIAVSARPTGESSPTRFVFRTRAKGRFQTKRIPAGTYRLQASSQAHRLRSTTIVLDEGRVREVTLELSPVPAFFDIRIARNTFTPDETPELAAHGFVRSEEMDFQLYRVDVHALLTRYQGSLRQVLYSEQPPEHLMLEGNPALTPAARFSAPITQRDAEGVFHQRFSLGAVAGQPGIYVVAARADSLLKLEWLMVTRLGLVVKHWGDQALAYVADLKTGEPVPGAQVELSVTEGGTVSGVTDEEGIFRGSLPGKREGGEMRLLAQAEKDGSPAFLTEYIYRAGEGQERVYCYTDRPVYRPGHLVNFKGIARSFGDSEYEVLADKPALVQVWDPRESLIYKADLKTNAFGSFASEFRLNEEAATGLYRLVTTMAGRPHESYFKVAEYRKPEYTVEVTTGKKRYTRGENVDVKVSAQYYFGAPVAGAEARYLVRRSPYWLYPGEEEAEEEGYEGEGEGYYDYGEVIEEGTARTDAEGIARFTVRTKRSLLFRWQREGEGEEAERHDWRYTIEVTVTDPSRKEVTGEGSTLVTQGEFVLSLSPRRYLGAPGQQTEIEISAMDYDAKPVRGVAVSLAAGPETWAQRGVEFESEALRQVTTDGQGKAVFRFAPQIQAGYRIEARARDARGNRILGLTHLWVTGLEYADLTGVPYPELEIVADKKLYRRGDTASFLINTKLKGATALVTVEGPRLYDYRLVLLKGGSTRFEVPIRPEYEPNFFLSVALVRDKSFASQEKRVKVSVERRRLQVTVKPDKERYRPGERATYSLRTADWQGHPTPAEVSVGVVDESIYAVQPEMAEPIVRFFYPPRGNSVSTSYSFAQLYLDADKEAASIKVRKRFPDTAYWNPTVVTGADGTASVSFQMPDTLTTWRATVRGVTMTTEVGQAVAKVTCTKDLLVRLEMPRFLTQRDESTIAAVAHNYTRSDQDLSLWLSAPGLSFTRGLKEKEQARFTLAPEGVRRQDWQVAAPAPGRLELTAYLKAKGGLSDAMALPLPVLPHGRERSEWRSGGVTGRVTERLALRRDAVAGAGDLRVRLSPSIASLILGALDYLAQYPYGCTEQTMSAFLPDVVVAKALRELHLPNPRLEKELPDMVQKGLNRLYGFQHEDGGWGWWRYDQSDPWMTAYVVFGLLTAKENGFSVNERFLTQGLDWLRGRLQQQPGTVTRERIYQLYVLSLADRDGLVDKETTNFYRSLNGLDSYTTALLTQALLARGRAGEAKVAAEHLWRQVRDTQALASWPGFGDWGKGGAVETTALAFKALYAVSPGDPRLFRVVRWLVLNREGNHWVSTRDTAFVLYALTDFLKRSQELRPDYQAAVTVNGKPLLSRRFTQESLLATELEVTVPGGSLRSGDNVVEITKAGVGNLYYTLILRQFVGQEEMSKLITGAGISVDRQYFRMTAVKNPRTGVIAISPAPHPTTGLRSGESILVRITINSPRQYEYVVVEDPIPAGCEVAEQGDLEPWEWDRWWSDMEVRDEKVAIFARRLPTGTSTIEYHLRPQIPGDYHVMPTEVYAMYNPDLRGSGAEMRVTLR